MLAFQRLAFGLSRLGAGLACLTIVAMTMFILYEIVLRSMFSRSTYVLDEFVGYGIAASVFLSLGYALEHGSLIRVGLLVDRVRGPVRRLLEVVCAFLGLGAATLLIWPLQLTAWRSFSRGTVSNSLAAVPAWIPESLVLAGLAILWLQLLAYLLRQIFDLPPMVEAEATGDLQSDL